MVFLIVDLGTSSCRACMLREDGQVLAQTREPVAVTRGAGNVPGSAEIDPEAALRLVVRTAAAAIDLAGGVAPDGAGLSSMLGWVFLDKAGNPLRPAMIWADTRAILETEELAREIGLVPYYRVTARRLSPELLLPKLPWLRKREQQTYEHLSKVLSLKDYLIARLTGTFATDLATASYSGFFDVERFAEDQGVLSAAGLGPGLLPEARAATDIVGRASGGPAREAGLREGLPFIVGSVDGTTAMYGSGVLLPGVAALVSGTTDVLMVSSASRPSDPEMVLTVNPAMVDRAFLTGGAMGLSGGAVDYFAALFGTRVQDKEEAIAALPFDPGAPIALPGLSGERSPYWQAAARGALTGLGLEHGPAHLLRAVMEGCSFRLASLIEHLSRAGLRPLRIAVSGGGSRSATWNRLRAEVTGLCVQRVAHEEATVFGTALFLEAALAGKELRELCAQRLRFDEEWKPDPFLADAYRGRRRRFEALLLSETYVAGRVAWTS